MNAIALPPPDLPGLILEHVARIERSCSQGMRRVRGLISAKSAGLRAAVLHARIELLAVNTTDSFRKTSAECIETAIWFRGARATIEDGTMKLDEDNAPLLAALERVMEKVRELRAAVLSAQPSLSTASRSKQLRAMRIDVVQQLAATLTDVFAALEACRWAVLEREADDDIAAGRVSPAFTSAADAIAYLNTNA